MYRQNVGRADGQRDRYQIVRGAPAYFRQQRLQPHIRAVKQNAIAVGRRVASDDFHRDAAAIFDYHALADAWRKFLRGDARAPVVIAAGGGS